MRPLSPTTKRLLPLYIGSFLQGVPFWYAIEKLFMTSIGFNTATIGLMIAAMSIVMLVVETPSGLLADRWSRKGVIILGSISLLISAVIGGFSYSEPLYIVSCMFWGVFAALYSGTYDSVIYDTVLEEHGDSKKYEQYLGKLRIVEGVAFIAGALGGGLLAAQFGMRETYFISVPFILAGLLFMIRLREPTLHKSEVAEPVFTHIRQTFAAVLRNRLLLPVIVATVGFAILLESMYELNQLWYIASSAPIALYGVFGAVLFSTWMIGGLVVRQLHRAYAEYAGLALLLFAVLGLIFARQYWLLLAAQFTIGSLLMAYGIILSRKLHDQLPSKLRAGSSSVISTVSRTILVPGSIIFTAVANANDIYYASYILLGVGAIAAIAYVSTMRAKERPA